MISTKVAKEFTRIGLCSPTHGPAQSAAWISPCLNSPKPLAGSMASRRHARLAMPNATPPTQRPRVHFHARNFSADWRSAVAIQRPVQGVVRRSRTPSSACPEVRPRREVPSIGHGARCARRKRHGSGIATTPIGLARTGVDTSSLAPTGSRRATTTRCWQSKAACAPSAARTSPPLTVGPARSSRCPSITATTPAGFVACSARSATGRSGCSEMTWIS